MQDFDTLRNRVEETAQRMASAQSDRQDQTRSLVDILQQLEEKHAAQEQQLAHYKQKFGPLEQANIRLTELMENLLDLIDRGFGEDSIEPLRGASNIAATMLAKELVVEKEDSVEEISLDGSAEDTDDTDVMSGDHQQTEIPSVGDETAMDEPVSGEEVEDAFETESNDVSDGDAETNLEEILDAESEIVADDNADALGDIQKPSGGPDLALDETVAALQADRIEDDTSGTNDTLDAALEIDFEVAEIDTSSGVTDKTMVEETPLVDEAEAVFIDSKPDGETAPVFGATADEPVSEELGECAPQPHDDMEPGRVFEDVSDAVLDLETEEDAAAGMDDFPDVVKQAAIAAADSESDMSASLADDQITDVPPVLEDATAATKEAESIAALTKEIEEETGSAAPSVPAPSDIRALLLRVEALAKKANAMREAQGAADNLSGVVEPNAADEPASEEGDKRAGAAA